MNRRFDAGLSDVAQTLHEIIKKSPGIHFRSLGREAGLSSVGQLRHHLDTLRRHGVIVELQDGRFKRFFAAGAHDPRLREGLSRFARRVPRRIAKLLLSRPMNRTEIRRNLNCADSTLGYHLNRMVELGDLKRARGRNCCIYSLTDPEFVRYLLQQHPAPAANRPSTNGNGGSIRPEAEGEMRLPGQEVLATSQNGNGGVPHGPRPSENGSDRRQTPPVPAPVGSRSVSTERPRRSLDPEMAARARLDERAKRERERKRRLRDQDRSQVPSWLISA